MHQRGLYRFLRIDPLNPWDLSRIVREARQRTWDQVQTMRSDLGFSAPSSGSQLTDGPYVSQTATYPGIRASRRVHGIATSIGQDAMELRKYPDGIARASWEIDLHEAESPTGKGFDYQGQKIDMESEAYMPRKRKAETGDWFDVRYGCLVAKDVGNLMMAGRCISSDVVAHASLRIQQTCMAMGQAAGTAAAMSLKAGVTPDKLDVKSLTTRLDAIRSEVTPAFGDYSRLPVVEVSQAF
jgi:hypothetical protein